MHVAGEVCSLAFGGYFGHSILRLLLIRLLEKFHARTREADARYHLHARTIPSYNHALILKVSRANQVWMETSTQEPRSEYEAVD